MHIYIVLFKQLHVRLQDVEIREGRNVVVEINSIIPYENVIRDLCPSFKCLHEMLSRCIICQGNFPVTVNITEHYIDIRKRFDVLWRIHGIEVGQCGEFLIGKSCRQLIHKINNASRWSSLVVINLFAMFALAVGKVAVILTNGDHFLVGISFEYRVNTL